MSQYHRPSPKRIRLDLPNRGKSEVRWVQGPAGTSTMVLMHGWTASGKMGWRQELIDELSMRCSLLIVDLPGHANGPRPIDEFSFDDSADYVIDVCRQLKIRKAVLVGHSMGTGVALRIATKRPSLAEALMVIGGAATFESAKDLTSAVKVVPGFAFSTVMAFSYIPLLRNLKAESLAALVDAAVDLSHHNWKIVAEAGIAIRDFDGRADAQRLQCPAVVIVPLGDSVVPPANQCELADIIPNSIIIPIAGHHLVVWTDPTKVANAMVDGLREIRQMQHKQRSAIDTIEDVA